MFTTFRYVLLLGAFVCTIQAEPPQSFLRGRVLDPARAPIADTQVTAVAISDGSKSLAPMMTDQNGEFLVSLKPGKYAFKVVKDGFAEASQVIDLAQSGAEPIEILLHLAPVRNMVTVTEAPPYLLSESSTATKTQTPLRDVPQAITVVTQELIKDQMMMSIGDVVRYVPGITGVQGEGNRDQVVIRGNNTNADFFVNGVRDDVEYFRDLYSLERVEALKGPNAMIFGRGGAGGVVNRVTKQAGFTPLHEITLQGGSFGNKRFATDLDQPINDKLAARLNGMYENSDSFRRGVNLERFGISPSLTIMAGKRTNIALDYEHFRDNRTADRGIPSFLGRPSDMDMSTFVGNPNDSRARAKVNLGSAVVEHQLGGLNIRNRTMMGDYDKYYRNYVPGAVNSDKTNVSVSAYDNATQRRNFFNQTDLTYGVSTGPIRHTLLTGIEIGRQLTNNFRNTGYFNNAATTFSAPYADPTISTPITFRQSATDADNHLKVNLGAAYMQDQIRLSKYVQVIAGVRVDHFDLQYHNNRSNENLRRIDNLVSPRLGLVIKPAATLSVYSNYSVSYLPSSGDQFSSLTTVTQQVKPEKFNNYEVGIKWDIRQSLSITTAVYRLDRTNTRATDPNDPTRIVQTGSQRTNGFEIGANGSITRAWKIAGGYAHQDAFVTSATTAARAGAQVAQVPRNTFSVWNNYQICSRLGAGLGILNRSDMYAAIDNTVTLPGYTRADAAVYIPVTERVRLQANIENVFNTNYFINAHSNNNISPGSSRALRVGMIARF